MSSDETTTPSAWSYEGYWNAVLGDRRSAEQVVAEFELVGEGLDEWLGTAEAEAARVGGLRELPDEWSDFHAQALEELEEVIDAADARAREAEPTKPWDEVRSLGLDRPDDE